MKRIKIKTLKKAIKDAEKRRIKKVDIWYLNGDRVLIKKITVSDITGMNIVLTPKKKGK